MKAVYQRVKYARVTVDGEKTGEIGTGVLLLVGVCPTDTPAEADLLAQKVAHMRVFCDENDKMNLSVLDIDGGVLVVSQFTLCANTKHGRRPDFFGAAAPSLARPLCERVVQALQQCGVSKVATGRFGADMQVELLNDGPVTLMLDTDEWKKGKTV